MIPYKDDNPSHSFPFVTVCIIVLNIIVFIYEITSPSGMKAMTYDYGAIPHNLMALRKTQPISPVLTVFSSMFMHGGLLHIGGNMLYLWIFGDNIEDKFGHMRFAVFYLFCGIFAAYTYAATSPDSIVPMIGASGAISGVLGAYVLLFPRTSIHTLIFLGFFITTVRIPALIVIGFWAIIQFGNGLINTGLHEHGGIAWFAHVGGFIIGILTMRLWIPRRTKRWL